MLADDVTFPFVFGDEDKVAAEGVEDAWELALWLFSDHTERDLGGW